LELVPDEAIYWSWSRHLALGYFDHPPMIAYLMRLGTMALGPNELGVRLAAAALATGTAFVTILIARSVLKSTWLIGWVTFVWLTSPLLAGIGTLFTPDTPSLFFSAAALYVAIRIAVMSDADPSLAVSARAARPWIIFGVFAGLGLLSKYTAALLPTSVALAMLLAPAGRAHYRKPWIYLGGIISLLVFSPVIYWNYKHGWASFAYQFHHGTVGEMPQAGPTSAAGTVMRVGKDLSNYLGGQLAIYTPILFVIAILVQIRCWRRYSQLDLVDRLLLWTGSLPFVFFGLMFIKSHRGEANWPAFAYIPLSILTARWLAKKFDGPRRNWAIGGARLAAGMWIGLHVLIWPAVTEKIVGIAASRHKHVPHAITDLVGWREYGRAVALKWPGPEIYYPVANRAQDAAEASFYMPRQPEVWCDGIGYRPTAFDYFDAQPDFTKIRGVMWIGTSVANVKLFSEKYGYVEDSISSLYFPSLGNDRTYRIDFLERPPEVKH